MKTIAQRDSTLLVALNEDVGFVYDLDTHTAYRPASLASLLKVGYWEPPIDALPPGVSVPNVTLEELLGPAAAKGPDGND